MAEDSRSEAQLLLTSGVESDSGSETISWSMATIGHNMTNHSSYSDNKLKPTCVQIEIMKREKIRRYWILIDRKSTIFF